MSAGIVIVHDDPSFREPLATSLRAAGLDVTTFADSLTAWDALAAANRVEILVTRVLFGEGMPHRIALARWARVRRPAARVLFVAQSHFREDVEGVGPLLARPVSIAKVAEAVERMLSDDTLGRTV